jgi:NitT/TauT family transport system substrate-binding protein
MNEPSIGGGQLGRRQFLRSVAGLGLSAASLALLDGCAGVPSAPGAAQNTLETTTLRVVESLAICISPQYLAEDFLKRDGFTNIEYVKESLGSLRAVAAGQADISMTFSAPLITQIDAGDPIVILGGVHSGCFELFGTDQIHGIGDLKGKTVAVRQLGSSQHIFLASMLAYVGVDPRTDITWVIHPPAEAAQLLAEGKIDAYMAFPPEPQELRAKGIGHVVVSSMIDKPWSQYFCCMVAANLEFMRNNPVATKRALRAILQAADSVAGEPERAARFIVDKGFTKNYDYALKTLQDLPYDIWRGYDPTDTLRFYALRLRDAGMIKSTPDQIIAQGTDWRFLNELKQELPAPVSSVGSSELLCHVGRSG